MLRNSAVVIWGCLGWVALQSCGAGIQQAEDVQQAQVREATSTESVQPGQSFSIRAVPLTAAAPAQATEVQESAPVAVTTKPISKDDFEATHSEVAPLVPQHDGQPVTLNTFRLDRSNQIVACIATANGSEGYIQVYSPEQKLVREFATPFIPTALTFDPSGNYLAAGHGKVGKFSEDGTVLKVADAPNVTGQDPAALRREIIEQYKESMQEVVKNYEMQIENLQASIKELEDKKAADEAAFSKRDQNRLKAMERQLKSYQEVRNQFSGELPEEQVTAMMQYRSAIPSIAANARDIYVTTSSGMGYEVWRTDHNFENAQRILSGLRGCCGQMDVYAKDDQLLVAENTRFEVGLYDREGVRQAAFGERAQGAGNGFGSCCNPMNVLCCSNGDILTAESSIGKIKRFDADGDLVGYVGKARIGGGCKHVALGYDEPRDRYYIQYQDKNQICILVPHTEAETLLAEKRAIQAAGEKIVAKIHGEWTLDQSAAAKEKPKSADDSDDSQSEESEAVESFNYEQFVEQMTSFQQLSIGLDDHKFQATLGADDSEAGPARTQNLKWVVASSHENQVALELEGEDGMVMFGAEIKVVDDDTIRVRFSYDAVQQFGREKTYVRATVPTSQENDQ